MRRGWASTARLALALSFLVLAACGDKIVGSAKPPESFGKVDTAFAGCPKIDGTYRWPPKEGGIEGYDREGKLRRDSYASPAFFGVSFGGPTEFDVKREGGKTLLVRVHTPVRTRLSHADQVRGLRMGEGSFTRTEHDCSGGWLVVKERDHPHPAAHKNYGGAAKIGTKLAPLEGGDLLVGQWVRVWGQRGSIISWGDSRMGNVPVPDTVYWRWARFERVK